MPFDRKEASKAIHLTHFPDKKEHKDNLSFCHICLKKCKLTKEHVPPRSAFNECNRLWDRLVNVGDIASSRVTHVRGGLWVKTICKKCNNEICSIYAKEYVRLVKQIVEKPELFDSRGGARLFSIEANPLYVAKEIATMILAVEPVSYARHNPDLRSFVMDKYSTFLPPFKLYAFLVPDSPEAGTVLRYHARVDTYAPGFKFIGGEISWFPFGFVYANLLDKGYNLNEFADITGWCTEKKSDWNSRIMLTLHPRITGVDSIQSLLSQYRAKPQIDYLSGKYT